ncbi:MAG TPA: porin family protein [Ignavibacteriaceae bacterium]|nr:porin family protein [Ignavibacteriaceae bacterium]
MKKLIPLFLSLFILGFSLSAQAQTDLKYGAKVGLNFANLSGNDAPQGASTRTGLVIGGFLTYNFAPMFGLQPEVLYSMKGSSGATNGVSYTFSLNYIEIPALLKFYIPLAPGSPISANLYAGPDFAFNVASSVETSFNGQTNTTDESSNTKGFDFNIMFGGGVGFNVGPTTLGVELRYTLGTGTVASDGSDIKNGVFAILASITF